MIRPAACLCAILPALAGCAGTPDPSAIGAPPGAYRAIAAAYLKRTLFDPYSVRDAEIAVPRPGQVLVAGTLSHASGWAVCYRANAKNRFGAYTGRSTQVLVIVGDQVIADSTGLHPQHDSIVTNCGDAQFQPFHELAGQAPQTRR